MSAAPYWDSGSLLLLETSIYTSAAFSMLGSLIIIATYIVWPDTRSPLRLLLVFLSINDLLVASGNIIGMNLTNGKSCEVQSFFTTFGSMCSFMWTVSIAIYLKFSISQTPNQNVNGTRAFWLLVILHTISWGIPFLLVFFALALRALGRDPFSASVGWCWIANAQQIQWPQNLSPEWKVFFWQIVAGKGIEIVSYIATPFLYISSKRELRSANERVLVYNSQLREALLEADRKLGLVPVVFLFIRIWGTFRLIMDFAFPSLNVADWFWLALLQGIGDSAQGWANCLLFCLFTRVIRKKISERVFRCTPAPIERVMDVIHT